MIFATVFLKENYNIAQFFQQVVKSLYPNIFFEGGGGGHEDIAPW